MFKSLWIPLVTAVALALGALSAVPARAFQAPASSAVHAPAGAADDGPVRSATAFWQAVAARVGVSPAALEAAVRDVHAQSMAQRRGEVAARVAERLGGGVTAAQVLAAFAAVRADPAAAADPIASAAKKLNVKPDELRSAISEATHHWHWAGGRMHRSRMLTVAARHLGLAPQTLAAELRKGQSLAQIAKARGRSPSGLEAALRQDAAARIHTLVYTPWPARPPTPTP